MGYDITIAWDHTTSWDHTSPVKIKVNYILK